MDNFNIDESSINKLKDMLNKGDLNDVISQIPPDMIKNFSSIMSNSSNNSTDTNVSSNSSSNNGNFNKSSNKTSSGFDFNNIDMNTILKMKSVMEKLNDSNDPRSNLLYSLKPYLRDSKKEKLDQYANLLNVAKIAELLKDKD